jgi:hypothetical protein
MNRGYWADLYWEIQEDGAAMLVRITINDEQNNEGNITAICWILRTVLATLLPSRPDGNTWVGAIVHGSSLNHVGGPPVAWRVTGELLAFKVESKMTNLGGRYSVKM